MKKISIFTIIFTAFCLWAENADKSLSTSNQAQSSGKTPVIHKSFIDTQWDKWAERSYNYGFKLNKVEVPIFFDAPIMTNSTIMVRGGDIHKKRWGLHVFEGYAADDKSRITMILNKHIEEGMPVAELYYYAAVYGQGETAYNWFRVGSDVPYHSYMFSRDNAIFYGPVEMRSPITLASIGKDDIRQTKVSDVEAKEIRAKAKTYIKPEDYPTDCYYRHALTAEIYKEKAKYTKAQKLKNAKDGTIFYDKDRKMVVIKIEGKWHKLETTPVDIEY